MHALLRVATRNCLESPSRHPIRWADATHTSTGCVLTVCAHISLPPTPLHPKVDGGGRGLEVRHPARNGPRPRGRAPPCPHAGHRRGARCVWMCVCARACTCVCVRLCVSLTAGAFVDQTSRQLLPILQPRCREWPLPASVFSQKPLRAHAYTCLLACIRACMHSCPFAYPPCRCAVSCAHVRLCITAGGYPGTEGGARRYPPIHLQQIRCRCWP